MSCISPGWNLICLAMMVKGIEIGGWTKIWVKICCSHSWCHPLMVKSPNILHCFQVLHTSTPAVTSTFSQPSKTALNYELHFLNSSLLLDSLWSDFTPTCHWNCSYYGQHLVIRYDEHFSVFILLQLLEYLTALTTFILQSCLCCGFCLLK